MKGRLSGRGLAGLVAIGLAAACGGNLDLAQRDGGAGQDTDAGPPDGASPGSLLFTGGLPGEDGGCSPASSAIPSSAKDAPGGSCWGCVAQGCSKQLAACAADCSCNATITGELGCLENKGGDCLAPPQASDDDALGAANICIQEASIECGCSGSIPDASAGCTPLGGGGGGGGNGECTSNFGETCGGTNYQVVCACPAASCVCFSGMSVTKTVSFDGCPYCPGGPGPNSSTDLLALCGFPH
jgi:hypothetical protein